MSPATLQLVARAHAVLAWVATIALGAALLRLVRRRDRLAAAMGGVAALAITLAAALGALLDTPYRSRIRQRLFLQSPGLGWLFERKEHLAFAAILFAWGAVATTAAAQITRDPARAGDLDRAARVAAIAAAALALAASVMSAVVAQRAHF